MNLRRRFRNWIRRLKWGREITWPLHLGVDWASKSGDYSSIVLVRAHPNGVREVLSIKRVRGRAGLIEALKEEMARLGYDKESSEEFILKNLAWPLHPDDFSLPPKTED